MSQSLLNSLPFNGIPISLQIGVGLVTIALVAVVYSHFSAQRPIAGIPLVTLDGVKPTTSWFQFGNETLEKGFTMYPGQPFQVMTGMGPQIVLPNRMADEIGHDKRFSFGVAQGQDFFKDLKGFEGVKEAFKTPETNVVQAVIRIRLTQSLGLITGDLVEEATHAVDYVFGEDSEWHTIKIKKDVSELVARLSSRTFLGKPLCRDREWLDLAISHAVSLFGAARELRPVPAIARSVMQYFLAGPSEARRQVRAAHKLISKEVQQREAAARQAIAEGRKPPKKADTVAWMVEQAKGAPFDLVASQLSLSAVGISTTAEFLCQALMDLSEHCETLQPLREEVVKVLGEYGWTKPALGKLRLMDSFLKESMRLHRPKANVRRAALETVVLSDGTRIQKGRRIMLETRPMDPSLFANPTIFDPYRFVNLRDKREAGEEDWQLASATPGFMHFGYGHHACPGRFFAVNETKIALCFLLLKYDWRLVPGQTASQPRQFEGQFILDGNAELQIRRRKEEIDLANPA